MHITEAYLNSHFGDEESIVIRAEATKNLVLTLKRLKPIASLQEVLEVQTKANNIVLEAIANKEEQMEKERVEKDKLEAVVPHTLQKNTNTSYKTIALDVARATGEALKRSEQQISPQPKRLRRIA